MITSLIFSKNRACQLDLLLRSIEKNFKHVSNDIRVLYTATTSEFQAGYDKLILDFPNVLFNEEVDFQRDTIFNLTQAQKYICFFVDDNIVYRKPEVDCRHISVLFENIEEAGCFSFRLGKNTIIQNPYTNPPLQVYPLPMIQYIRMYHTYDVLVWDWSSLPPNNFGYSFSVDGHVYETELILKSLDFQFETPNAFEGRFPQKKIPRAMFCLSQSAVVNNCVNLVGSSNNNAGVFFPRSLEELNQAYLDSKQIDLDKLCQNEIVGCHQEMEIQYVERG